MESKITIKTINDPALENSNLVASPIKHITFKCFLDSSDNSDAITAVNSHISRDSVFSQNNKKSRIEVNQEKQKYKIGFEISSLSFQLMAIIKDLLKNETSVTLDDTEGKISCLVFVGEKKTNEPLNILKKLNNYITQSFMDELRNQYVDFLTDVLDIIESENISNSFANNMNLN